jgi:ABC-type protease/lipase transport system fused ATPase/permease subunit
VVRSRPPSAIAIRGLDAKVGCGAAKHSGGQRQRVAIAHRLSTIAVLDRLIVMDEGRIVDDDERSPTLGRDQVTMSIARFATAALPVAQCTRTHIHRSHAGVVACNSI